VFYHLHPTQVSPGHYEIPLPPTPAGDYRLFAEHQSGFPETPVGQLSIPTPIAQGALLTSNDSDDSVNAPVARWLTFGLGSPRNARGAPSLLPCLVDADGNPADSMELYMGMAGHAVIARRDLSVFAHVHPSGTVPMAALMAFGDHSMMPATSHVANEVISPLVSFPYGFPQPAPIAYGYRSATRVRC